MTIVATTIVTSKMSKQKKTKRPLLSIPEQQVLEALREYAKAHPGEIAPLGDIAAAVDFKDSWVSRLIASLEKKGYCARKMEIYA